MRPLHRPGCLVACPRWAVPWSPRTVSVAKIPPRTTPP